ncbi:MAG: aminopeptidase P family protein [Bacteroidales bacterium]|nr:aminopeptidase P family protein [Bacteroidales bacterium]
MFSPATYQKRRDALRRILGTGAALFMGNKDVPFNYPANTYRFRQDSSFLYFFGINDPCMAAIIDADEGKEYLFGNDATMDDIIWTGEQPSMPEKAAGAGMTEHFPYAALPDVLGSIKQHGRHIHFLPPYRGEIRIEIFRLLGIAPENQANASSTALIRAIVRLRSVKEPQEIEQMEQAIDTAYRMHVHIMEHARAGMMERELCGAVEGIASAAGGTVSFPVILTVNGQILHNHCHDNILQNGQLLLVDAGAENVMGYPSDITRTVPVSGKFDERQREIYHIVLQANMEVIRICRPGMLYRDVHLAAARIIADGLTQAGLMKGNVEDAVEEGAHALFFPHGIGHALGLDVHDMENLGEDHVGYDESVSRSTQFGLSALRMARRLEPGFTVTGEPGVYFIPALIDQWESERRFTDYIRYDALKKFRNFGGIRVEDDLLITNQGCRVLGKPIPKSIDEIENIRRQY